MVPAPHGRCNRQRGESTESNNTTSRSIQIGADLTVSVLSAPATAAASLELVIPATTPPGRWYLIGTADGPNNLVESIETNNASVKYIDISTP